MWTHWMTWVQWLHVIQRTTVWCIEWHGCSVLQCAALNDMGAVITCGVSFIDCTTLHHTACNHSMNDTGCSDYIWSVIHSTCTHCLRRHSIIHWYHVSGDTGCMWDEWHSTCNVEMNDFNVITCGMNDSPHVITCGVMTSAAVAVTATACSCCSDCNSLQLLQWQHAPIVSGDNECMRNAKNKNDGAVDEWHSTCNHRHYWLHVEFHSYSTCNGSVIQSLNVM